MLGIKFTSSLLVNPMSYTKDGVEYPARVVPKRDET